MFQCPLNPAGALGLNRQVILDSCLGLQFLFLKQVLDVQADVLLGRLEQVSHLGLGQPDRLAGHADI